MYIKYPILHSEQDLSLIHFRILSVNVISYDANWHSTLHHHNFTEIIYCLEGAGYLQTEFGREPIHKNSLILVNPYVTHTEHTSITHPLKYLAIGIQGPEIILPSHASDTGLFCFDDEQRLLYPLIKEVLTECQNNQHYSSQIIDYLVNILVLRLNNIANAQITVEREVPLPANVAIAKHYIDNHFSQAITLETLEQRTHISRFHLVHQFKEELGMSPIQYLNQVRLARAQELLLTTNYTVLQISELVGFNTVTYFSTKFKETLGLTPREFRHTCLNVIDTTHNNQV